MSQQIKSPGSPRKNWLKRIAAGCAVLGAGIQFIPVPATVNPASQPPLPEKPEVAAILKRACYDCHSHEVNWRWYTKVAPASWLVARDVIEGRKGINFSDWPEDEDDRQFNREAVWDSVKDGSMPPWFYTPLHPEAVLSDADKAVLKAWSETPPETEEAEGDEKSDKDEDDEKKADKDEDDDKAGDEKSDKAEDKEATEEKSDKAEDEKADDEKADKAKAEEKPKAAAGKHKAAAPGSHAPVAKKQKPAAGK